MFEGPQPEMDTPAEGEQQNHEEFKGYQDPEDPTFSKTVDKDEQTLEQADGEEKILNIVVNADDTGMKPVNLEDSNIIKLEAGALQSPEPKDSIKAEPEAREDQPDKYEGEAPDDDSEKPDEAESENDE